MAGRIFTNLAPPANQSRLHTSVYNYSRGEQRWLGNHSCYETAATLSPMAIFTMIGRPVDHQAVHELSSHSLSYELGRFTGANLVKIVDASNYVGLTPGHFYLLPSSALDAHRLRSCIRYIVRVIKSKQGNGHIPSWSLPQRFTPPVEHDCPYIYTLQNDTQIRSNAYRVMMEDIRAREDDDGRLQARARISGMALALGLEVVEVPGDGNCFLHAALLLTTDTWLE